MPRKPIHEIAKEQGLTPAELGRRGGKKPKRKRRFMLLKKRNCNTKCPIYERCYFIPLSKADYKGKCGLANSDMGQSSKMKYLKKLTSVNKAEFEGLIWGALATEGIMAEAQGFESYRKHVVDLMAWYRMKHGKERIESVTTHKGEAGVITFEDLRKEYEEFMAEMKEQKAKEKAKEKAETEKLKSKQ